MTVQNALAQTDFYKYAHPNLAIDGVDFMYGNYTSRNGRLSNVPNNKEVVFVGLQYFIKDVLLGEWNDTFFNVPKEKAIGSMKRIAEFCLGQPLYDTKPFEDLHDLGYLPLKIKALPEGVSVPYGVPPVTFVNTVKGFDWLEGFLETVFSTENWPIQTSATTAKAYLKRTVESFDSAGLPHDLVPFMCHDFSLRGCFGRHAGAMSGFGHLTSFAGTDTIPAILFAEKYYNANMETELVGASVNATEHSISTTAIMSMVEEQGISKLEAEVKFVQHLMKKAPTGVLSHVSDSFDFWAFVTEGLPVLKEEILSRDGKLVIRPDSGDPVKILTGLANSGKVYTDRLMTGNKRDCDEVVNINGEYYLINEGLVSEEQVSIYEVKGLIECLGDLFGTTESPTGLKLLHDNIGAIYGDSITLERQDQIIKRLEAKGYAGMVVLGIGSYSYQYVTRDSHGSAVKSTWAERNGIAVDVCKDPKTDAKKKSLKGLIRVELEDEGYVAYDQQTPEQESQGELKTVFEDGVLLYETSLAEIRQRVKDSL